MSVMASAAVVQRLSTAGREHEAENCRRQTANGRTTAGTGRAMMEVNSGELKREEGAEASGNNKRAPCSTGYSVGPES